MIVYTDAHKNGKLITKSTHLHNSKLASSKFHEEKALEKKRERSHASGAAICIPAMLHSLLLYSEVSFDQSHANIDTTPLEFRHNFRLLQLKKNMDNDNNVGNICNNIRKEKNLPEWRNFTDNQMLILKEHETLNRSTTDRISEFSVRPPELLSCFDTIGNFYRWFHISEKPLKKENLVQLISFDVSRSIFVDGHCRVISIRKKAMKEVIDWLENVIANEVDFNDIINGKKKYMNYFITYKQ